MKKLNIVKTAVFLILIIFIGTVKTYCYSNIIKSPQEILRIQEFLKRNISNLNEENKVRINEIEEKLKRFEALTQEELDYIRECERNVIRQRLGDVVFEEYSKLIRKRESSVEFTPPERFRLLEIERQLKN